MDSLALALLIFVVVTLIGHCFLAYMVSRFAGAKKKQGQLQQFSVKGWTILTLLTGILGVGFFVFLHGKKTS